MSTNQADGIEAGVATAKAVLDHLIAIATGKESNAWLAKYVATRKALAGGQVEDAVRESWKLVDLKNQPTWAVSAELARRVDRAMGNLAYELKLPNPGKTEIRLDDLPTNIQQLGTIAEERQRKLEAFKASIMRDPLEQDPSHAETLAAASRQAEAELADHPMKGGLGFCHVFWETKKRILRSQYGLEWQSPAELNPNILFD